jgi:hypothetical protein
MSAIPIERDANTLTGAEYAAASLAERLAFHSRQHAKLVLYYVCLRCGFPVAYGGQTCEACPLIPDSAIETPVTPLRQPPADLIRNAAQMASAWAQTSEGEVRATFATIAARLTEALDAVSEPSPEVIAATETMLRSYEVSVAQATVGEVRDLCAVVLRTALTGAPQQ